MEAKMGKFFESVGAFFGGGDQIPWCDRDVIAVSISKFSEIYDVFFSNEIALNVYFLISWVKKLLNSIMI